MRTSQLIFAIENDSNPDFEKLYAERVKRWGKVYEALAS